MKADLRLNRRRTAEMYRQVGGETFSQSGFSYEAWVRATRWAEIYTDAGPEQVFVEPTNACSGQCFGCPNPSMQRARESLAVDRFQRVAEAWSLLDCRWVFSGLGEPLLNTDLPDFIRRVGSWHTMLITSVLVDPPEGFPWDQLDLVSLTADALEEKRFSQLRPGCSWSKVSRLLEFFVAAKQASPEAFPEIGVTLMKSSENADLDAAFLSYWRQVSKPPFRNEFGEFPLGAPCDKVQWFQIKGPSDFLGTIPYPGSIRYTPLKRRACLHGLTGFSLHSNGTIALCPFDVEGRWPLGHLGQQSPEEIWTSPQAKELRRQLLTGDYHDPWPCSSCQDWYHSSV